MTCTNTCGSCQCTERAALIAALERMGYTQDSEFKSTYTHTALPYVIFSGNGASIYREQFRYDEVLSRLRPYRIKKALLQRLRITPIHMVLDGEQISVEDMIDAIKGEL